MSPPLTKRQQVCRFGQAVSRQSRVLTLGLRSIEQIQLLDFVAVDVLNAATLFIEAGTTTFEITGVDFAAIKVKPSIVSSNP